MRVGGDESRRRGMLLRTHTQRVRTRGLRRGKLRGGWAAGKDLGEVRLLPLWLSLGGERAGE